MFNKNRSAINYNKKYNKRFVKSDKIGMFLFGLVFFFCFFVIIFFAYKDDLSIQKIHISGRAVPEDLIMKEVQDLNGKVIFMINNRKLESRLREKFEEIYKVEIVKNWPNTIYIKTTEWPIVAVVKQETKPNEVYLMNKAGKITAMISEDSEFDTEYTNYPVIILNKTGSIAQYISKEAVKPNVLNMMFNADEWLKSTVQRKVYEAKVFDSAEEIHIKITGDFSIWLNAKDDLEDQLERFYTVYSKQEENGELDNVLYFDTRIPEKVFLGLKN